VKTYSFSMGSQPVRTVPEVKPVVVQFEKQPVSIQIEIEVPWIDAQSF
jgi:hypothetical protein